MISAEDAIWTLENGSDEDVITIRDQLWLLISYLDTVMANIPCGAFSDAPAWDEFEDKYRKSNSLKSKPNMLIPGTDEHLGWHKYPDERPTDEGRYLVTTSGGTTRHTHEAEYMFGRFMSIDDLVVAWAELPKPYMEV